MRSGETAYPVVGSGLKETWGASRGAPLDGADVALVARTAGRCCKSRGKELTQSEIKDHAPLVQEAKEREFGT